MSEVSQSITGKTVVVTGAGGSIGSELVLQIAAFQPTRLILVDHSELNLYQIGLRLDALHPAQNKLLALCDIRNTDGGLSRLIAKSNPDILFHAAALKHVPLMENEFNLFQGVRTNLLATAQIANLCRHYGVRLTMISTDKAVYPTSLMGLTKRAAEIAVQTVASMSTGPSVQGWSIVRFGNVLNSSGSVVPRFEKQIAEGGPVTVTHPDMTRYMMTIQDAVRLTLTATRHSSYSTGLYTYILDMGVPVKIYDLACDLIERAGLVPGKDIEIEITGIRPGEKLYEELYYEFEKPIPSGNDGIKVVKPRDVNASNVLGLLDSCKYAVDCWNVSGVTYALKQLVPEFTAQEVLV